MSKYAITLTKGHVLRHAPAQSTQGAEAALIDIAQDLLLRALADEGALELLVFKGGTALRKVYAGARGRFSTDLDFSVANLTDEPAEVQALVTEAIDDREIGPFRYRIEERRGRAHITYENDLGLDVGALRSKLDIGPPPWLTPVPRPWVPLNTHRLYGGPLPELPTVRLEENVAEKIARLNRRTFARDAYDLVWLAREPGVALDHTLTRRLAVLKCWVDKNGLNGSRHSWSVIADAREFDAPRWLAPRAARNFDDEQIGLLTTPPPDLDDLGLDLGHHYAWLAELTPEEQRIAKCAAADRGAVIDALRNLDSGGRMTTELW